MSDEIQVIKNYIKTPEGTEWFMNAVKDALDQIRVSEEKKGMNHIPGEKDLKTQLDTPAKVSLPNTERNIKSLRVSRRELEKVIQWTEKHPIQEKDGRYILKVILTGGRLVLKSTLLMKGESVSNSQLIADDPKKILSGDIIRVTTRGAHSETYTISLID